MAPAQMRYQVFALAAGIVLAACGTPSTPAVTYQSYTYSCCAEIAAGMLTWHPGQQVGLHWQPQAGPPTPDNSPNTLSLRVRITGPFKSVDALKQAISQGQNPPGVRTIDAKTLAVNDRTANVPTSELDLPADLAPGYYNLEPTVSSGGNSESGSSIVTVQ